MNQANTNTDISSQIGAPVEDQNSVTAIGEPVEGSSSAAPSSVGAPVEDQNSVVSNQDYYGNSTGEELGAGAEGLAQGLVGPLAPLAERGIGKAAGALGFENVAQELSPEAILARQQANPWIHGAGEAAGLVGGLFIGTGEGALAAKAGAGVAKLAFGAQELGTAGKIGASILSNAMTSAILQGSDEVSKAIINDPSASAANALSNMGATALLGGAIGGVTSTAGALLKATNVGNKITSMLGGVTHGNEINDAIKAGKITEEQAAEIYRNPFVNASEVTKAPAGFTTSTPLQTGVPSGADALKMPEGVPDLDESSWKTGLNLYNSKIKKYDTVLASAVAGGATGGTFGAYTGWEHGNGTLDSLGGAITGGIKGAIGGAALGVGAGLNAKAFNKAINFPVIQRYLQTFAPYTEPALEGSFQHVRFVQRGAQQLDKGIESLFTGAPQQLYNDSPLAERGKLKEIIDDGGINQNIQQTQYEMNQDPAPRNYAEGGYVDPLSQKEFSDWSTGQTDMQKTQEQTKSQLSAPPAPDVFQQSQGVAEHFPEQNIIMNAARGRVSNYLSSLKPQKNQPKLAFDAPPDDREAEKSYNKALDIANRPLSVIDHINNGTLEPEHVKHFNALYPEVADHLNKKLTERITQAQVDGEKPSYKVRQGLSLLMGTSLSGEMVPQNIQAAQAVFAQQAQAQQQSAPAKGKNKKNTSTLTKAAGAYATPDQARQERQQTKG